MSYTVKALNHETWPDFERLAEKHNGVWGGCWCTWFHKSKDHPRLPNEDNKAYKKRLVSEGQTHASLVFDGDKAIGWCQFGTPSELPAIYHKKQVEVSDYVMPDYRITCFFVDRDYRQQGVAKIALEGALDLISMAGGGIVEGYPEETKGEKTSSSFLYSSTANMFKECGFELIRDKGKKHTVMRRFVENARDGKGEADGKI